jgi:hypothetical protein
MDKVKKAIKSGGVVYMDITEKAGHMEVDEYHKYFTTALDPNICYLVDLKKIRNSPVAKYIRSQASTARYNLLICYKGCQRVLHEKDTGDIGNIKNLRRSLFEDGNCCICYEQISGEGRGCDKCGCMSCLECYTQLKLSGNNRCPVCRDQKKDLSLAQD